ncbi:hypothetical protein ATANTOWER_022401 [Ataeniobius toweri]|uniref:Uncharacterized protein n=1 Tax=Ataeniobius toweri TaxID=208326 RepID=A0ABU7BEB2_9TELE|nr:hypothetical protein [Ataeniobius toweri]
MFSWVLGFGSVCDLNHQTLHLNLSSRKHLPLLPDAEICLGRVNPNLCCSVLGRALNVSLCCVGAPLYFWKHESSLLRLYNPNFVLLRSDCSRFSKQEQGSCGSWLKDERNQYRTRTEPAVRPSIHPSIHPVIIWLLLN